MYLFNEGKPPVLGKEAISNQQRGLFNGDKTVNPNKAKKDEEAYRKVTGDTSYKPENVKKTLEKEDKENGKSPSFLMESDMYEQLSEDEKAIFDYAYKCGILSILSEDDNFYDPQNTNVVDTDKNNTDLAPEDKMNAKDLLINSANPADDLNDKSMLPDGEKDPNAVIHEASHTFDRRADAKGGTVITKSKKAMMVWLQSRSALATAKAKKDPLYFKLVKFSKLRKQLISKLNQKYRSTGMKRAKEIIKTYKASTGNVFQNTNNKPEIKSKKPIIKQK